MNTESILLFILFVFALTLMVVTPGCASFNSYPEAIQREAVEIDLAVEKLERFRPQDRVQAEEFDQLLDEIRLRSRNIRELAEAIKTSKLPKLFIDELLEVLKQGRKQ